ncbi:MAG: HlyD family efflux transporter periplasmic adaptor subunit [Clostridia bacterium]|nr:HlyD family efflux transporter periplasmic adaptor subunit [Clostridia bacterium]
MKRILALLTSLLLLGVSALADEQDLTNCAIANGSVSTVEYIDIVAPYSGTLALFDLEAGDKVKAGDTLFTMLTTTVYASEDAEVKAVFAQKGDDATAVMSRYGGLVAMEPSQRQRIAASILQGYNSAESRTLSIGDTLYFRSDRANKETGYGVVVMISGTDFVVDVLDGEFVPTETIKVYRDDDYESRDHVGTGSVTLRDPLLSAGQGRVASVLVGVGDTVESGDPLLTLMSADAAPSASPIIIAPVEGVVGQVAVVPGQQVWKGQMLARILLTDKLEVVAQVDEIDLNDLWVGDKVPVILDTDEDWIITGTVTEISQLGTTMQNAAYYTVHVSIPEEDILLGASASVYIPRD